MNNLQLISLFTSDLLHSQHTIGLYPETLYSLSIDLTFVKVVAALSIPVQALYCYFFANHFIFETDYRINDPRYFLDAYFELWVFGLFANIAYDLFIIFFDFSNTSIMDSLLFQMLIFSYPISQITSILHILYIFRNTESIF